MSANQPDNPDRDAIRRQRAEEVLQGRAPELGNLSTADTQALIHELQVHQIELEMQNDELRQAQLEIVTMRDQFADLYDFAPVGYLTIEATGLISQANLTSVSLLGKTRSQLIKKPFSRFVFRDDQDTYYLHFKQIIETQTSQTCEIRLEKKDGSHFYARLDGAPVKNGEGGVSHCRVTISDITEQKQADAVRQENEILRAALEKEKELAVLRDQLMLTIAHEFRTPLSIILISSAILEEYGKHISKQKSEEKLSDIRNQVWLLSNMVDSLMFVVKTKRDSIQYRPTWLDPVEFCAQIVTESQGMTQPEHHLIFTNDGHFNNFYTDRDLLSHLLNSLISNAIKYSPEGGSITVHLSGNAENLIFRVSDEGIGIPQDAHQRIYEPFYRASNVETIGGIGMGLTIVQEVVSLLGGSIECTSVLGSGTTFSATIPIRNDHGAENDG